MNIFTKKDSMNIFTKEGKWVYALMSPLTYITFIYSWCDYIHKMENMPKEVKEIERFLVGEGCIQEGALTRKIEELKEKQRAEEVFYKRDHVPRILKIVALNQPINIYEITKKLKSELETNKKKYNTVRRVVEDLKGFFINVEKTKGKRGSKKCSISQEGLFQIMAISERKNIIRISSEHSKAFDILKKYDDVRKYVLINVLNPKASPLFPYLKGRHGSIFNIPFNSFLDVLCLQGLLDNVSEEKAKEIVSKNPKLKDTFKRREEIIKKVLLFNKFRGEKVIKNFNEVFLEGKDYWEVEGKRIDLNKSLFPGGRK